MKLIEVRLQAYEKASYLTIIQSYDGSNFKKIEESKYSHERISGLSNYQGQAFITGCSTCCVCSLKTEILNLQTMTWSDADDYPYTSGKR